MYTFDNLRITPLTPRLLRVEHTKNSTFTDAPTQTVQNREFPCFIHTVEKRGNRIILETQEVQFILSAGSGRLLCAMDRCAGKRLSKRGNLRGTRRTLDVTFGRVPVGKGILSRGGLAVLDDSRSLVFTDGGEIVPRTAQGTDRYYFAYGRGYRMALRDFFCLTGHAPVIPRPALGNWWSRYKAYTQEEYLALMKRFQTEGIPLSVGTVDMDWHLVDLSGVPGAVPKAGKGKTVYPSGWTGYTWNTALFPDYKAFLAELHGMGLQTALNLHPADGVRPFECQYKAMCQSMGLDAAKKEPIPFDLADLAFRKAYFEVLHRPYERDGVDFWWIDWQQGRKSSVPGLDPLWQCNHWHTKEATRGGREGIILSRYAGAGSHRYPLGFSGDTFINWSVLRFQPEFTAVAANIGYGWWSHDIGGHMLGRIDDELYLRWLQFGVFSPVNRLHSTNNPFAGKEPWKRGEDVRRFAGDLLRLRHRLVPYIYSIGAAHSRGGDAPCTPIYHAYPDTPAAYQYKNSYFFGSELLAAPITRKTSHRTRRAWVTLWLPPGVWTDIFTGQRYAGGQVITVWRGIDKIPVFAKAGAMLPLAPESTANGCPIPEVLELHIWRGSSTYTLHEECGTVRFTLTDSGDALSLIAESEAPRELLLVFRDCRGTQGEELRIPFTAGPRAAITVSVMPLPQACRTDRLSDIISAFQMHTLTKDRLWGRKWLKDPRLETLKGPKDCRGVLREVLLSE
ncbi:MAG: alpha-xylosidase [Oscillospiraceae bacterium]|jgi:alpha-glucosidase (family GH31 glycosyl hydrolase)|nr:alpha-xylosidase [Oscillospiraceae bacterium]